MNKFNLFGDIVSDDSERWFESDVTPAMFIGWLAKQSGDIEVNINSNGGSVSAGLAIANAIKGYKGGKVTGNVLGLAASMASVVACACSSLTMGKGAFLMIHNPWGAFVGEAGDLRHEADVLDQMKASMLAFYQSKFAKSADELIALMDAETWIPFESAAAFGLSATAYAEELKAAACATHRAFAKAPEAARAFFAVRPRELNLALPPVATSTTTPNAASSADSAAGAPVVIDWEARYKGLSKKLNEANEAHAAELERRSNAYKADLAAAVERHQAALNDLNAQLDTARGDLEKVKADLSTAAERADKAERELAAKSEQLDRLNHAHTLLTGGVLSPSSAANYEAEMATAKSAKEREALRKRKAKGQIK